MQPIIAHSIAPQPAYQPSSKLSVHLTPKKVSPTVWPALSTTPKMATLALATSLLGACQSTPPSISPAISPSAHSVPQPLLSQQALADLDNGVNDAANAANDNLSPDHALAKTTLTKALERQRRSSYAYHVTALASNAAYRNELKNATPQQLSMSDDVNTHCAHVHDTAYVDMLQRAESAGVSVADDQFAVQRAALKSAFMTCQDAYDEWEAAQYADSYASNEADHDADYWAQLFAEEDAELAQHELEQHELEQQGQAQSTEGSSHHISGIDAINNDGVNNDGINNDGVNNIEAVTDGDSVLDDAALAIEANDIQQSSAQQSNGEFLPNYDNTHTQLDKKRADLLNDYLLAPLTLTAQGVYRPLAGQFSLMPTMAYQVRNQQLIAQHYIYVDAKNSAVYVWADTFAHVLSYYFDAKLGTQMHNKWLKLDLNDGSLPQGFGRDFIHSHFLAVDTVRAKSAAKEYRFIAQATLLTSEPTPDKVNAPYLQAPQIIERRLDKYSLDTDVYTYRKTLYQQIADKYPELLADDSELAGDTVINDKAINSEAIDPDTDANTEANTEAAPAIPVINYANLTKLDSRFVITKLLALMRPDEPPASKNGNDSNDGHDKRDNTTTSDSLGVSAATAAPTIAYATLGQSRQAKQNWYLRDVYGLNNRQTIAWHLRQYQRPAAATPTTSSDKVIDHLLLESLTRYTPLAPGAPIFASLPQGALPPNVNNADNVIDFATYGQDLLQRYKDDEGTARGNMIFKVITEVLESVLEEE